MGQRSIGSGIITFGLVNIPFKLFTAATAERISFNMITPKGNRVKQIYSDSETGEQVERGDCLSGYEYSKGEFVTFTKEELEALQSERANEIEVIEFVPKDSINLIEVEKSYYIGPNKGGDKSYSLLSRVLDNTDKAAVGRWYCKGKEHLVVISPNGNGLILHQMFYASEIRCFENTCDDVDLSEDEIELATKLINKMSSKKFDNTKYQDGFVAKINSAVEQKINGQAIKSYGKKPKNVSSDLAGALKSSISGVNTKVSKSSKSKAS